VRVCVNEYQICDSTGAMGGGGPRVKCANIRTLAVSPEYVSLWSKPWDEMSNASDAGLTKRQFKSKGMKGAGGASSSSTSSGTSSGTNGCGEDERGHQAKGGASGMAAHMAYNQDGYYTAAASCYIAKKFKEMGGAAPASD